MTPTDPWAPYRQPDGTIRISAAELAARRAAGQLPSLSDPVRFDATTEADIARQIAEDPDTAPDMSEALAAGAFVPFGTVDAAAVRREFEATRAKKTPIALRVDPEVLAFFRAQGPRYQTRMHAVLRAYVRQQVQKAREAAPPPADRGAA